LQAALSLKSVIFISGLAGIACLKPCLFFHLLYNIVSQKVLPAGSTEHKYVEIIVHKCLLIQIYLQKLFRAFYFKFSVLIWKFSLY